MATTDTNIDMKQPAGVTQVASNSPAASDSDEQLELALRNYVPGTDAEKRLVRKIDFFLVPVLWGMCVLCYLNRNNIVSLTSPVEAGMTS
jgi:hypothetical protein